MKLKIFINDYCKTIHSSSRSCSHYRFSSKIWHFDIEMLIIQQIVKEWHTRRIKSLFVRGLIFLPKAFCECIYQHWESDMLIWKAVTCHILLTANFILSFTKDTYTIVTNLLLLIILLYRSALSFFLLFVLLTSLVQTIIPKTSIFTVDVYLKTR